MVDQYNQVLMRLPADEKASFQRDHLAWFKGYARDCDDLAASGAELDAMVCVTRYLSERTTQLRELARRGDAATARSQEPAYKIGGGVSAPVPVFRPEPEYSEEARNAKWQGAVLLQLVVDENGVPQDIKVVRSLGLGLDQKAIEAVRKWRFKPGLKDGKPVPVSANIEVNFRLL